MIHAVVHLNLYTVFSLSFFQKIAETVGVPFTDDDYFANCVVTRWNDQENELVNAKRRVEDLEALVQVMNTTLLDDELHVCTSSQNVLKRKSV